VNIRRGTNIIDSLNEAFNKQALTPLKKNYSVSEKLQSIYLDHFKPVYLIFDQLEELFIFGSAEEKTDFIKLIREAIAAETQCRIIFVIREEFLAGITEFEYDLPDIFSNRFRVEKIKRINAIHAIEGPCKVNRIKIEAGFSEELVAKLCPTGNEIELTFLQVYLDRIFHIAITEKQEDETLTFSKEILKRAGSVSDLLAQFLEEQIREMDDPDTGMSILKSFVSVLGTKKQMTESEIHDSTGAFGTVIEEPDLIKYLEKFVDLRILKEKNESGHFELRHDSLASKIYEKFTAIEKDVIEVRQFIDNAWTGWKKRKVLISADDLSYIAPYESRLYLSKDLSDLISRSKKELVRAKRRRRNIAFAASVLLFLVLGGFTIWALKERKNALFQQNQAIDSRNKAIESEKQAVEARNKATESEKQAIDSRNKATESEKLAIDSRNKATDSKKQAVEAKNKATESEKLAVEAKNKAIESELRAVAESKHSRVLLLVAKAKETNTYDPTRAIRYAQLAYKYDSTNDLTNQTLCEIYHGTDSKQFYVASMSHTGSVSSSVFSPDGKTILTSSNDKTARLWDLSGNCLVTFSGHSFPVNSAIFSPEGKTILTASPYGIVKLWDLNGNCLVTFSAHERNLYYYYSSVFSPDGKTILTSSFDKTARLWDLSGKCLTTFSGHLFPVNSVIFSPDGKTILTASGDYSAKLWDLSGNCLVTFSGHTFYVNSAVFSPDGKTVLTSSSDKSAKLWDLSGKCLATFSGHTDQIFNALFSPDGKSVITASGDNSAKLWDLSGKCLATFSGHTDKVSGAVFSPDGKTILTSSSDKSAKLWDLSGKCLTIFFGHTDPVFSAVFSPDGGKILTASADKTVKLWDLPIERIITYSGHSDYIPSAIFSPDCKTILTASYDKTAKLWDLSGKCLNTFLGHTSEVTSANFSPDGQTILTASYDKTAKLWDLSGKCLNTFFGHTSSVYSAVYSPDGKTILTASSDNSAKLWDLSGNCLVTFSGHSFFILSAIFSSDGKTILTASYDKTAKLWDLSGKCLETLSGHTDQVFSAVFSPDGRTILTSSADKTAKLWDLSDKCLVTFSGHTSEVYSAIFSPDGKTIFTASNDGKAKLWDLSGKCLVTFSGHTSAIYSAIFSPDGRTILTSSADKTAKLWDLSGKCLETLSGHTDQVFSAVFSPDGGKILTASQDNTAKLWLTPESICNWIITARIGRLSPLDKAEINEPDDFKSLQQSDSISLITEYSRWYLSIGDIVKAEILYERAFQLNPKSFDRKILGDIYRGQNKKDKYSAFYKDEPEAIIKDDISALKDTSSNNNYTGKFIFYSEIAKLYEQLLQTGSSLENKITAASNYNSMGWYGLFSENYSEALNAIQRGIELDPTNEMLFTNLPLCYLLTNQFEKAKSLYLDYKDKTYVGRTFMETFLSDIAELEKAGITHPDFEKVKALLKK
jgi:WD40 repeat protein